MEVTTNFSDEDAAAMVAELRGTFTSGKTRSYEWRISQLKGILKMMEDNENEIVDALRSDLNKPAFESVLYEVFFNISLLLELIWII